MAKVRVHNIAVSLDGFSAGPDQDLDHPMGVRGDRLHPWLFATRYGARMVGADDADTIEPGLDDHYLDRGDERIGATIMGRNMFGPVRDGWDSWDGEWTGWWGPEPPYHHPVFVLTHHPRPPLAMDGGTTFTFVTDGIDAALDQALAAADGADVRIAGGASTVQQYVRAGVVDVLNVAIVPVLLGRGERLLDDLGDAVDTFSCTEVATSPTSSVTHVVLTRGADGSPAREGGRSS